MNKNTTEISIRGKWVKVPCLDVGENKIIFKGRWLKVASIHDEWWLNRELENPEECIRELKKQNSSSLRADILTFMQMLPGASPRYGYPMEMESVAAARTGSFKKWWESLPQETRKNVRRSQKRGVSVTVKSFDEDLIRGIADINNESRMRQGVPNDHWGKSFDEVKRDHESFLDRSDFICAYFGNELIGFLKLVYKGNVSAILNLAVKASHSDKRPANALIAKAAELCEAKNISYMTYGLFNYGNKKESPLREFKERNGFEEILTPRYYIPLTNKGNLCMKLNLHRGLIGFLPHGVIRFLVNARSRWYNFVHSSKPV